MVNEYQQGVLQQVGQTARLAREKYGEYQALYRKVHGLVDTLFPKDEATKEQIDMVEGLDMFMLGDGAGDISDQTGADPNQIRKFLAQFGLTA